MLLLLLLFIRARHEKKGKRVGDWEVKIQEPDKSGVFVMFFLHMLMISSGILLSLLKILIPKIVNVKNIMLRQKSLSESS